MKRVCISLILFIYLIGLVSFVIADNDNISITNKSQNQTGQSNFVGQNDSNDDSYRKGVIIVYFKDNSSLDEINLLVSSKNLSWEIGSPITSYGPLRGYVKVPEGDEQKWITIFESESIVKFASLSALFRIDDNSNDENETEDDNSDNEFKGCRSLYWFDKETNVCGQKEFCVTDMYKGLKTFKEKEKCEKQLQERLKKMMRNRLKIHSNQSECPSNCTCSGSTVKCEINGGRIMTITAGKSGNIIVQIKGVNVSTNVTLFKDDDGKVKGVFRNKTKTIILPDEAFQKVKDRLNAKLEAGKIELDEDGTYKIETRKRAKFLGLVPVREKVQIQLNSETGEVIKIRTSWWGFLAKDTKEKPLLGADCGTVTPGANDECCKNKGYDLYDSIKGECILTEE